VAAVQRQVRRACELYHDETDDRRDGGVGSHGGGGIGSAGSGAGARLADGSATANGAAARVRFHRRSPRVVMVVRPEGRQADNGAVRAFSPGAVRVLVEAFRAAIASGAPKHRRIRVCAF